MYDSTRSMSPACWLLWLLARRQRARPLPPVHAWQHVLTAPAARQLAFHELAALYAITDVALVTSLRDGMNLVSYEYVACQSDNAGALLGCLLTCNLARLVSWGAGIPGCTLWVVGRFFWWAPLLLATMAMQGICMRPNPCG